MWIDFLFLVLFLLGVMCVVFWTLFWSPFARSTNELHRLNKIVTPLAEKKQTPEYTLLLLTERKWRYHRDKVDYWIDFCKLLLQNIKSKSCCYLKSLQQKGNKEAEKELIDRWGRIPESQAQAENCKCCGKIDVMATIKSLSTK